MRWLRHSVERPPQQNGMGRLIVIILMAMLPAAVAAQDDPEYKAEIGVGIGTAAYQGDLSGSITKNMQPMFMVAARYRMNPRSALALSLGFGNIKGVGSNAQTWYPEYQDKNMDFKHSLVDATVKYEYNFWPYGTGREYRGAVPLTPYITGGLGFTNVKTPSGSVFTTGIPLGMGVRYKLAERVNVALEWMMHFTFSDKLDGVYEPYGIESKGLFKNTDSFSVLGLTVSYDIWKKCKTCNNDNY